MIRLLGTIQSNNNENYKNALVLKAMAKDTDWINERKFGNDQL